MRLWNFKGEQNCITAALQVTLPEHAVISLTGAGGKTTLLSAWARELALTGKKVVITTTTHMASPEHSAETYEGIPVIYADGSSPADLLADIDREIDSHGLLMVASPDPVHPAKVMAPPDWVMEHLNKTADVILIEADGSRRMPLKWPAEWEPVVPEDTDITVCVTGLSALGRPLADVMFRHDSLPEPMRRDKVDENLICAVLASPEGGQKDIYGEFRVFLNQADTAELQKAAAHMQQLFAVRGIQSAWGSLK